MNSVILEEKHDDSYEPRENDLDISMFNPVAEALGIDPCKKRIQELISEFDKSLERILKAEYWMEQCLKEKEKWEEKL